MEARGGLITREPLNPADGWNNDRERVRSANPIEEVVAEYLTLLPDGRNFKALCPFHGEKTPSFKVDPERGTFHCFGCGERGDVFSFVQKQEGLEFRQALELLAQRRGISLEAGPRPTGRGSGLERTDAYDLLRRAQRWFQEQLGTPAGRGALEYLRGRGFQDDTIRSFGVGFAPPGWTHLTEHLRRERVPLEAAAELGLVKQKDGEGGRFFDAFRGRIIFPIRDLPGRTLGFGARVLSDAGSDAGSGSDGPKYLNSPESSLFKKGQMLYGHHEGREAIRGDQQLILVEGYTDVMMAHQAGLGQAVATLGTALTEQNVERIRRVAQQVILLFDGDRAGREAARKSVFLFAHEPLEVRVVLLEEGTDPCEILRGSDGVAKLKETIERGQGALEFFMDELMKNHGAEGNNVGARQERVANELFPLLERIPSEIRRREGWQRLASRLRLPEKTVQADFERWRQSRRPRREIRSPRPGPREASPGRVSSREADSILLVALMESSRAETIFALVPPERLSTPAHRRLAELMQAATGPVDATSLEDPAVKSKYLELIETLEDVGVNEEHAVDLLRDVLVRRIEGRAQELRATLADSPSKERKVSLLAEHGRLRGVIAQLRGTEGQEWGSLQAIVEHHFCGERVTTAQSNIDMESRNVDE